MSPFLLSEVDWMPGKVIWTFFIYYKDLFYLVEEESVRFG